jgi:carbamoyltransferase
MRDGELVAAAQEERFSRVKNDRSLPRRAFRYCLNAAGMAITDVDLLAYYEDANQKLGRQIWMGLAPELSRSRREGILNTLTKIKPDDEIRELLGYDGPIEHFDHHLSHAASSFYYSGFEEAAIATVDGVGEWATTTYGFGSQSQMERFEQVDFPDSLGLFYSAITSYLGFEVNEGEYKVMGLAPYGKPIYADHMRELVQTLPGGQYRLNQKYFSFLRDDLMYSEQLSSLLGHRPRTPSSEILPFHQDVARSAQLVLEEILLEKIRYLYNRAPSENLCLAGGVALNCVANSRILKEGPFKRLFVQPAAGDAGGALGAAALAYVRARGDRPVQKRLEHAYLGPSFSASDVYEFLQNTSVVFGDYRGRENDLIGATADRLIAGEVIGWFQGRMEFGPRALGARSILADPRRPEMRDRINKLVKMREAFRPFAPTVLESKAAEHFDLDHPSPFMLETSKVKSSIALPATTHVDGSARVQTVDSSANTRFALLLEEFEKRTQCPILLNTSFNVRGEPIVCNPFDAIMCFVRSRIDALVLEDFVIDRASVPPLWKLQAQGGMATRDASAQPSHLVYTFL